LDPKATKAIRVILEIKAIRVTKAILEIKAIRVTKAISASKVSRAQPPPRAILENRARLVRQVLVLLRHKSTVAAI
jgi:hypothetical protein